MQPQLNQLILKRVLKSNHGIIGRLFFEGNFLCYTLENTNKAIPEGVYNMEHTPSAKFGLNLPLLSVPNRVGIRIHMGNTQKDTSGCILVGEYSSPSRIINSRIILRAIVPFLRHINSIKICSAYERNEKTII